MMSYHCISYECRFIIEKKLVRENWPIIEFILFFIFYFLNYFHFENNEFSLKFPGWRHRFIFETLQTLQTFKPFNILNFCRIALKWFFSIFLFIIFPIGQLISCWLVVWSGGNFYLNYQLKNALMWNVMKNW